MLLKLSQAGDPALRQKARKLTVSQLRNPQTQQLIDLMISTLRDYPGVGLAAPQVGENKQLIIVEDKEEYHKNIPLRLLKAQRRHPVKLTILVNPVVEVVDKTPEYFFEGCLSVEGYRAIVPRFNSVRVHAKDRQGSPITIEASGWYARILQHEIDHLNGSLYLERMLPGTFMTEKTFNKDWKTAGPTKIQELLV